MNNVWNSIKDWWNGLWGNNKPEEQEPIIQISGESMMSENEDVTIVVNGSIINEDTIRLY